MSVTGGKDIRFNMTVTTPAGKKKKIEVVLHRTLKDMLDQARADGFPQSRNVRAFARVHFMDYLDKNGKRMTSRRYRTVRFCLKYMGAGVVAHEMAHMALFILGEDGVSRVPTDNSEDGQEDFCYLLQDLVRVFWDRWYSGLK